MNQSPKTIAKKSRTPRTTKSATTIDSFLRDGGQAEVGGPRHEAEDPGRVDEEDARAARDAAGADLAHEAVERLARVGRVEEERLRLGDVADLAQELVARDPVAGADVAVIAVELGLGAR